MGFSCLDHNIIDISLDRFDDVIPEHMVHTLFVRGAHIPQAKGHGSVAIHVIWCDKRSRELVGLFHLNLMVIGVNIKKGQGFTSCSGIDGLIDPRQRLGFPSCFLNQHRVS